MAMWVQIVVNLIVIITGDNKLSKMKYNERPRSFNAMCLVIEVKKCEYDAS